MAKTRARTLLLAAASAVTGLVAAAPALPAAAKASPHRPAPKTAIVGPVKFWECPKKTTRLLVAVNPLTLHPGTTLTINFTVKNGAAGACNYTAPYASVAPGPTASMLEAGPCGSVGFAVVNAHGHSVWPGPQVVNCPALGFAQLGPGATVSGSGSWNQDKPNSTQRVPAGRYTLVVDNKHFSFPLTVAAS